MFFSTEDNFHIRKATLTDSSSVIDVIYMAKTSCLPVRSKEVLVLTFVILLRSVYQLLSYLSNYIFILWYLLPYRKMKKTRSGIESKILNITEKKKKTYQPEHNLLGFDSLLSLT